MKKSHFFSFLFSTLVKLYFCVVASTQSFFIASEWSWNYHQRERFAQKRHNLQLQKLRRFLSNVLWRYTKIWYDARFGIFETKARGWISRTESVETRALAEQPFDPWTKGNRSIERRFDNRTSSWLRDKLSEGKQSTINSDYMKRKHVYATPRKSSYQW